MAAKLRTRPPSNATEVRELLLWARAEKIVLGQVTIGECTVTVLDLGAHRDTKPKGRRNGVTDLRSQFAGEAKDDMIAAGILEDDDEAAVQ